MSCHSSAPVAEATTATPFTLPTEAEIRAVTAVLRSAGQFPDSARMAYVGLLDPVRGTDRTTAEVDLPGREAFTAGPGRHEERTHLPRG